MPQRLDLARARTLLHSREHMLDGGRTERELHAMVSDGTIIRVRRGWYAHAADWNDLWNEGRHLLRVLAVVRSSGGTSPVYCGVSAAVLLGLPLYRLAPQAVHVVIQGTRHGRTRANVVHHNVEVSPNEIVEIDGIRLSSLDRTVLDLACSSTPEAALSCADAALRTVAVQGQQQDPELAERWHQRLRARAAAVSVRGIRQARSLLDFADGRAQLPGESVSRLQLRRLGFTDIELQTRVVGPRGEEYWMDFAFRGARVFGEFDGRGKYLDAQLRGDKTADSVVLEEKAREDAVRGVTGWGVVRWESEHIDTPDALGMRLRAFGLRPD